MDESYLDHRAAVHCSPATVAGERKHLRPFFTWCRSRRLHDVRAVTAQDLDGYAEHLATYRTAVGELLRPATRIGYLQVVRGLFGWLHEEGRILGNPAARLEVPKLGRRLPVAVLTAAEAEQVLALPDVGTKLGLRDRAILEMLYSTGLRRAELVKLTLGDLDATHGVLLVREGKNLRDRVVPVGERALGWVSRYLEFVRPRLVKEPDPGVVVLTRTGGQMSPNQLTALCGRYLRAALPGKPGSCHVWRHTAATLMLDAGADTRHVQELLGHACLESTQVYTHVTASKLKAVHAACHPAEQR